jgi:hypothetical protein
VKAATGSVECRICRRDDVEFFSQLLKEGVTPRAITRRIPRLNCRALERHRDRCLRDKPAVEEVSGLGE